MTGSCDPEHPLTRAFELGVLVPIGLATVLLEELPRLTELGRRRVNENVAVARLIGELVVRQGRREIERRLTPPADTVKPPPSSTPPAPTTPVSTRPVRAARVDARPSPTTRVKASPKRRTARAPSSSALPLEDYESLAAGHVVSLLAELSPDELDLVEAFESAHRNRRTVLGRISQLRSGA